MGAVGCGAVAAVAASCATLRGARARPPNVVFAFSDEHRWQSMASSEMPEVHTPAMAQLASEGVEFTHCISNYPVCSPYRAILMSGRWPYQQGVIDNNIPLAADAGMLGTAFKAAGYDTAYVGKWHLGGTRAESFGFDRSLIWTATGKHWDRSSYHPREGALVTPKGYNASLMTDQALEFIGERRTQPFFLMLSWNPPHASFLDPPEEKKRLYPEGSLSWRKNVDLRAAQGQAPDNQIWNQNSWPYYQGYHAHVSAIDDELARLMAALDELALTEDTILIYTSDHGTMLGSHGVGSKRQPYEESIRVPCIFRWPGQIPRGRKVDALLGAADMMPTLCGAAGVAAPASCVGQDFSPWLRGAHGPDPEAQLIMHIAKDHASGGQSHPAPIFRGLRTMRYTYAVYPDRPWCLFDNERDSAQLVNLVNEPGTAALRSDLTARLRSLLREAKDPFVVPE